jgi:hypothetical protein
MLAVGKAHGFLLSRYIGGNLSTVSLSNRAYEASFDRLRMP